MLFIDHDHAEIFERQEQGRSCTDHHTHIARCHPAPDIATQAAWHIGMPHGGRRAEPRFEACEELGWCGGIGSHLSRLMNGEVTIDDMAIERYTEYATWCIEDGELEEAAKIISRLIDAKGGE